MNGLGFDKYTAKYLTDVKRAAGTFPAVTTPWVIAKFTSDWFATWGRQVKACWLFIGGNAASHALDLFGNYPLTWTGSLTHNTNGVTPDGTTGHGEWAVLTDLFPNAASNSFGFYSRTNTTSDTVYDIGATGTNSALWMAARMTTGAGVRSYNMGNSAGHSMTLATANALGLHWSTRQNSTNAQVCRNASGSAVYTTAIIGYPSIGGFCAVGGLTGPTPYFSAKNSSFAFVSAVGGAAMATSIYNLVQALQTHCGRQV